MIAHQPFDGVDLVLFQPKTWRYFACDLGTQDRMILGPSLADIVQQERGLEYFAIHPFAQD